MHTQTWPSISTTQASLMAADWIVYTIAGLIVSLLVWGLILFAAMRWRKRDGDASPPQFRNNYLLEITWTVIPLLIVFGLFLYSQRVEARVDALAPHPDVTIHVLGYRWGWRFSYDGGPVVGGAAGSPINGSSSAPPPEMVLPLLKVTRIEITSIDVDHSFWVPDFMFKRDAIPGLTTAFDLEPNKLGSFVGHCAQFCGLNHALMSFTVRVVTPDQFQRWRDGVPNR